MKDLKLTEYYSKHSIECGNLGWICMYKKRGTKKEKIEEILKAFQFESWWESSRLSFGRGCWTRSARDAANEKILKFF